LLSETGTEREFSVRVRHADGSWRTLHVVAHNLLQHPAVRGVIMTAQDETERRRLEMQFQQSQKMEAVGRLAGGVAHDFNNLLTVIMGNTAMLLSDEHSEATRGVLLEVRDAAQRAAGLTRQLLAFSRQQVLQPRVLQLNDIVVGMNNMIMRLLGEDIEVQLRLSEASPPIRADAGQLEQALLNLAVNARDAMPHGGLLTLATGPMTTDRVLASQHDQVPPGNYACLEVSDTGHGIDPSVMPRVFEPFFTTKDVSKGTGLGLATVYGIMKQSGGYVTVRSAPERGSNFRLLFPALQDQEVPHLSEDSSNGEAQGSATILLIEDETAVRSFAKRALEQRGYRVIAAASGLEAIEHAREYHGQIHLIVSDVVLPDINGREASDRICQVRAATRVLFMSGYTEDEMIHRGVRSNGLNFLQKPFGPAELIDKVRKILGH
jgi:two-component system cell cycle sensor histidine kinase/response regulator CckA